MIDIDNKIKEALLQKNSIQVEVYRAIKNEILKFKTQKNAPEYTEAEELNLIKKLAKSHEESIEAYKQAGRNDLVENEEKELSILNELLPIASSKEEIEQACLDYISAMDHEPAIRDMGKMIKYLKMLFPINDGEEIANIVKSHIN